DVDQFLVEGFLVGEALRLQDDAFGDLHIASALGGDGAHEGGGVVGDLFFHHIVRSDGRAPGGHEDGMGGSGVGAGSHGGDVGTFENEEAGGGGAAARGSHVNDDRHRRGGDLLDDVAHRGFEPAGCAQIDKHSGVTVLLGGFDTTADEFRADRLDGVVDGE